MTYIKISNTLPLIWCLKNVLLLLSACNICEVHGGFNVTFIDRIHCTLLANLNIYQGGKGQCKDKPMHIRYKFYSCAFTPGHLSHTKHMDQFDNTQNLKHKSLWQPNPTKLYILWYFLTTRDFIFHGMWIVAPKPLPPPHLSGVLCHMSFVIWQMSHVMCCVLCVPNNAQQDGWHRPIN